MSAFFLVALQLSVSVSETTGILSQTIYRKLKQIGAKSNDQINMQSFQKYNCESLFLDWSSLTVSSDMFEKIVGFEYDVVTRKGVDISTLLASIQNRLLRYIGDSIFIHCYRKLEVDGKNYILRHLDEFEIIKITTAPGDEVAKGGRYILI